MESAITLAQGVLEKTAIPYPLRVQLLLQKSKCLVTVGKLAEARELERENYAAGIDSLSPAVQDERILLEADRLYILAGIENIQAYFDKSLSLFHKALDIYQRLAPHRQGSVLNGMAIVHAKKGDLESAQKIFEQALGLARESGNILFDGKLLSNLGNVYESQRHDTKSLDHYQQARAIFKKIGNAKDMGNVLGQISSLYNKKEEYKKSLDYRIQPFEYHTMVGNKRGLASCNTDIGSLDCSLQQIDLAFECYQKALSLHRSIGNRSGEAITLGSLASLYANRDQLESAKEHYHQAIAICELIQYPAVHYFRGNLAKILATQDQFEEAFELIRQSEHGLVNIPFRMVFFLCNCIRVYQLAQQPEKAMEYFLQAQDIVQSLGLTKGHKLEKWLSELESYFD